MGALAEGQRKPEHQIANYPRSCVSCPDDRHVRVSLIPTALETRMESRWNDFEYAKEFEGNLHPGPVPARVSTKVHMMTEEMVREVRLYRTPFSVPQYAFNCDPELPMHPSLEAMGRHYFRW